VEGVHQHGRILEQNGIHGNRTVSRKEYQDGNGIIDFGAEWYPKGRNPTILEGY
jgi:hypothetical protein